MQTVNFTCGHCKNLMAVGQEFLGQAVRCPHCQQVVLAPGPQNSPPLGPTPGEPVFHVPPLTEQESIFSSSEAATDDIFANAPAPRLEMPTDPPPPVEPYPNLDLTAPEERPVSSIPVLEPAPEPTYGLSDPSVTVPTGPVEPGPEMEPTLPTTASWMEPAPGDAMMESATDASLPSVPPRTYRRKDRGWLVPLLIFPLISYAILATIAVIILYNRQQNQQDQPHPLEMMPDIEGDNKGGARKQSTHFQIEVPKVDKPLPPHLRVTLGKPITIGELEVTPQKVELHQVWVHTSGYKPEQEKEPSLVLFLHLRNLSEASIFKPMDRFFDRQWKADWKTNPPPKEEQVEVKHPYTYLQLEEGGKRFVGGPFPFGKNVKRETALIRDQGKELSQEFHKGELGPHQELTTFICTDPKDKVAKTLEGYSGQLLWRIQLRRGLVKVKDNYKSSTAVIGVEFSEKEIHQPG